MLLALIDVGCSGYLVLNVPVCVEVYCTSYSFRLKESL
ncbi:unnamed protein product [Amoebophrya sp. A25]|nr:unnamed protein product [Amoebophrya sp. A25]|eukprot:GSA25T00021639001.1